MNMFSRRLTSDNFTNLISPRTTISGNLYYDGVLKVQGTISGTSMREAKPEVGDKRPEFTIIVDKSGLVSTKYISCKNAIIMGKLVAQELKVENTLRIYASAEIKCSKIYYRLLEIEPGATLHDCQLIHLDHASKGEIT